MVEGNTTAATEMAMRLHVVYRWCVTGTPIQRQLDDLYALLRFLKASPFDVFKAVPKWFAAAAFELVTIFTLLLRNLPALQSNLLMLCCIGYWMRPLLQALILRFTRIMEYGDICAFISKGLNFCMLSNVVHGNVVSLLKDNSTSLRNCLRGKNLLLHPLTPRKFVPTIYTVEWLRDVPSLATRKGECSTK